MKKEKLSNAEYLRRYFQKPEIKEKQREYMKIYMKTYVRRPYVIKKLKKYRNKPEVKKRLKEYITTYNHLPETKEKKRLYAQRKKKELRDQEMINKILEKNDIKKEFSKIS